MEAKEELKELIAWQKSSEGKAFRAGYIAGWKDKQAELKKTFDSIIKPTWLKN